MPFLAGAAEFVVRGNEAKAMTSCASASSFKCWLALVLLLIVSLNQSQSQQSHRLRILPLDLSPRIGVVAAEANATGRVNIRAPKNRWTGSC